MHKFVWLLCPICRNKTRTKLREDTELINFPMFCPKCKNEILIHVKDFKLLTFQSQTQKDAVPIISEISS